MAIDTISHKPTAMDKGTDNMALKNESASKPPIMVVGEHTLNAGDTRTPTDDVDGILDYFRTKSTSTISRSDSDTSIEYQVNEKKIELEEEPISPTPSQRLLMSPTGDVRRPSVSHHPPLAPDEPDVTGSITSEEEDTNFLEAGEHLEPSKRKVKLLKIDRDSDFCRIETVTYKIDGKKEKYHYIKSANAIANTGLEPEDELISVNGKILTGLDQHDVCKTFRRIRPKHGEKNIHMKLTLRRWKKSPNAAAEDVWTSVYKVKISLTLVPVPRLKLIRRLVNLAHRARGREYGERTTFRVDTDKSRVVELKDRDLKPGCISDIELEEDNPRLRMKIVDMGSYLLRSGQDLTASGLQSKQSGIYNTNRFTGHDDSPSPLYQTACGMRLYQKSADGDWFMTSNLKEDKQEVFFKVFPNDNLKENLDERCFLFRSIKRNTIFESLLYRENFLCYDASSKAFRMKHIEKTLMDAYYSGVNTPVGDRSKQFLKAEQELKGCWFERCDPDEEVHRDTHIQIVVNMLTKLFACGATPRSRTQMNETSLQRRNTMPLQGIRESPV